MYNFIIYRRTYSPSIIFSTSIWARYSLKCRNSSMFLHCSFSYIVKMHCCYAWSYFFFNWDMIIFLLFTLSVRKTVKIYSGE